jgi:beta-ureidopropionase
MAEIVRAGLIQQRWTGDKESMIAAAVDHIATAASAGAQFYRDRRPDQYGSLVQR